MANLSSLINATTTATGLANLILVSPQSVVGYQPQATPSQDGEPQQNPPAILFNFEGEQNLGLQSDITDHYVEDNTAVQNQIALRPEEFTTTGYVGELNDVAPRLLQPLKETVTKLTILAAYTPELSTTALIAYNRAFQAYQVAKNVANAAVSAWGSITGDNSGTSVISGQGITIARNQTKQQIAFQQFYGYWRTRTLFTIQTPWAIFQNMAIKSLRAIQSEETRMITDFEVTFKLMRFAETITIKPLITDFEGRSASQSSELLDLGVSTPPESATSFTDSIAGIA